jgi:hypothetical protein
MTRADLFAVHPDAQGSASTSGAREPLDDKAIRLAAANAYAIATLMHSDVTNLFKLNLFLAAAAQNKKWQGLANQKLRSVHETAPWLADQINGSFMAAMASIIMPTTQEAELKVLGFTIPANNSPTEEQVSWENDMADAFAKYSLHLMANRLQRELWMWSWPSRSVRLCFADVGATNLTLKELQADYDNSNLFKMADDNKEVCDLANVVSRSLFQNLPVMQLVGIARSEGWILSSKSKSWCQARFRKLIMSQLVEDSFNKMKVAARQQLTRTAREIVHFKTLASSNVLGDVHDFKPVPWDTGEFVPAPP